MCTVAQFVITEDYEFDDDDKFDECAINTIEAMPGSPLGWGFLPTVEPLQPILGTSWTRDAIVQHVSHCGYWRPADNVEHQVQELHELGLM